MEPLFPDIPKCEEACQLTKGLALNVVLILIAGAVQIDLGVDLSIHLLLRTLVCDPAINRVFVSGSSCDIFPFRRLD